MKRIGFLFEKAFTKESLYRAYLASSNRKHGKRACYRFDKRVAFNIDRLHEKLHNGSYKPSPYYSFTVFEPKPRKIYAPAFCDLVVQHAIYAVIYDLFNNSMIDQSYACRVGKGTHKAADYAQAALQNSNRENYTIKLDISKFFYSIDREILKSIIEKKIKDDRFIKIMMDFADYGDPVGIPIGNLLSQIYALIYLNPLDHFIKRVLKVKKYCRYVDDFILFDITKDKCIEYKNLIIKFIKEKLNLCLSRYTIASVKRGVNFVGFRSWAGSRFIRKHSLYKFKVAAKKMKMDSLVSILGHAKKTHSIKHMLTTLKEHYHDCYLLLPKTYRPTKNCRA